MVKKPEDMSVVGVIHARGGSKRIPLKNIKLLAGKPLVAYIIEAALKAKTLSRVIVSSDHPEIIRISREAGAEVPFVRPADIAEDVPSELVTQHAIRFIENRDKIKVDIAVTMQPTTPFCGPRDIDGCVNTLIESDAESVITGNEIHERPEWMFYLDEKGYAHSFLDKILTGEIGVSQSLPKLYVPNGGVYATTRECIFERNAIIGKKLKFWIMSRERSVDIDNPIDFHIAEVVARELKEDDL